MRRAVHIIVLGLAAALATAGGALADRGVALDLGKLEIAQALTPGGGYRLPPLGVRNPGDEVTSYKLLVTSAQGQTGTPVPADWVDFEPRKVTLRPGETKKVQARLSLPTSADPGDYEGLLAAQIVTDGEGAQVGAAAAAKVTFEVEAATLLGALWHRIQTSLSEHQPWTWLIPSVLALALAGRRLRNRFSFRVERRA